MLAAYNASKRSELRCDHDLQPTYCISLTWPGNQLTPGMGARAVMSKALSHVLQQVFSGLLIGAMLPYWFSSMTMKSVGKAALAMVDEVRHQFNTIAGLMEGTARPDYKRCVEISTKVRSVCSSPMYPCIDVW